MFHWYTDIPMHRLPHFILLLSSYTVMSCLHITVTHACMVSLFLSYGFPFILHVLLFHVIPVFLLYDCFPLLDTWAVDMRCVESHIYCSRFPLYCSMLSTELRSCSHDTCIMHCSCSCYTVYFKYQIIKIIWVWGRLNGWLDHIGWMSGSIICPTAVSYTHLTLPTIYSV